MKEREHPHPRIFWPLAVIGMAIMVFGVYGLFDEADRTRPHDWVRWFLGAALAHDLVLAPVVAVIGVLVATRVPPRYRPMLQGALIASGIVSLTVYPFVRGYGRTPDNPSILPNNYGLGLFVVVAAIWVVAGAIAWRTHRKK